MSKYKRLEKYKTEEAQLEAVKKYGNSIEYIEKPSEKIKLEAVKQNSNSIYYIESPSEEVQREAVKKYGNSIQYIKNPSEKILDYVYENDIEVFNQYFQLI